MSDEHAEWLDWRRGGLGGSDVAQLVPGLSPYGSPYALWADKTGIDTSEFEPSEAMRWGSLLENIILDEFSERTGLHIDGRQAWCTHPIYPWARCTPDGFVVETSQSVDDEPSEPGHGTPASDRGDGNPPARWGAQVPVTTPPPGALGVVQVKCSGWPADWTDGIPAHIEAQVQWEMFVTGLPHAWVVVLMQGRRLDTYEMLRDDLAIARLVELAEHFWVHHVQGWNPPSTDGSEATSLALAAAYREAVTGIVVPLDDLEPIVAELADLRAERKRLDTRVRTAENQIKAALGPAEAGTLGDHEAITWHSTTMRRVDLEALALEHPDLVEQYRRPTTIRRLLVKPKVAAR